MFIASKFDLATGQNDRAEHRHEENHARHFKAYGEARDELPANFLGIGGHSVGGKNVV